MTQTKKKYLALVIYCLCFYTIWTIFVLCIEASIDSWFLKMGIIKTAIWTLPAMLLIHKFHDTVQIGLKEMFVTKVKWWRYLWVYALLAVWVLLNALLRGISFSLEPDALIIVLFVGITEEMVFRGWLLNATIKDMTKWLAVFINAVMYLTTHFPSMIQDGVLFGKFAPSYFIGFMSFSVIFSVSFLKSKNLLIPITMHMLFDLMAYVLF